MFFLCLRWTRYKKVSAATRCRGSNVRAGGIGCRGRRAVIDASVEEEVIQAKFDHPYGQAGEM